MATSYVVGSTSVKTIVSQAIRAGLSPQRIDTAAPPYHAVPVEQIEGEDIDRRAVCGVECTFVDRKHGWRQGLSSSRDWCPECVELVPGPE